MTLEAAIACTRFGLGARTGEIDAAGADPEQWLLDQLTPASAERFPNDRLKSTKDLVTTLQDAMRQRRSGTASEEEIKAFRRTNRQTLISEVTARVTFGAMTPAAFHERLVRFWSNHFTVATRNPVTTRLAGAYEREAIRPNILGSFETLAARAVFHPGMLSFLDNIQSIGPTSRAGKRRGRGLNENLAREILELHTVTPAAGYTQDDVTEFAKALTGWTVGSQRLGRDRIGETIFEPRLHEPGARRVLGKRYGDGDGDQAREILRDLTRRPETAEHIARKLARHIISDTPPATLVERLKSTFLETGGDLSALYKTLLTSPAAWAPERAKLKTPDELVTSAARMLDVRTVFAGDPGAVFEGLAQRPFGAPSPEGWSDLAEDWITPDALTKRLEWANRVGERAADTDARDLLRSALGERASDAALQAVSRAESGAQALTIALMSPDFQRR
ncbi:MAG: DUF1800 family protein [Pseudomonadota bacterium]